MNYEFKGTQNWHIRYYSKNPEDGFFIEADSVNGGIYNTEVMGEDFGEHNGYTVEKRLADAILISKAPEMFEMLKKISQGIHQQSFDQLELLNDDIKELLTKATQLP